MRKDLALWMLVAFLLGACGGGDEDENGAECGNGVVEQGETCDEEHEACEKCQVKPGWERLGPGEYRRVEICDNGEDDDDNGLVDCKDPHCDVHPHCRDECVRQADCSVADWTIGVCMDGLCRNAASFDGEGRMLVGEVGLMSRFDVRRTQTKNIKSFSIDYFHPAIPGSGEPLSCEILAERARGARLDRAEFNVIRTAHRTFPSQQQADTFLVRDSGVPATSETQWVTLVRFYEGNLDAQSSIPSGRMLAFACTPALHVQPGTTWDPSRQVEVKVSPTCESNDDCAEGWECITSTGLCAYRQCEPKCEMGYTCRQLSDGTPQCLRRCDPTQPCPANERCDYTPGWEPACYPF